MYHKAYGIIETLAPLHVGASAGEETGNLNLIFRDQFTQTGIIPGSSIRGRFRADMRSGEGDRISERTWYGHEAASSGETLTTEALVKFEYASLVWFPVFCPGQPIVWVSCPWLLKRYKQITGIQASVPKAYTAAKTIQGRQVENVNNKVLFFNLGFLTIENLVDEAAMQAWIPPGTDLLPKDLVVVDNNDIAMLHDMGLYRQSRVKLSDTEKLSLTLKHYQKAAF
jgi:CRISPR-associated protein Cmr4